MNQREASLQAHARMAEMQTGWPKHVTEPNEVFAMRIGLRRFENADAADVFRVHAKRTSEKRDATETPE